MSCRTFGGPNATELLSNVTLTQGGRKRLKIREGIGKKDHRLLGKTLFSLFPNPLLPPPAAFNPDFSDHVFGKHERVINDFCK